MIINPMKEVDVHLKAASDAAEHGDYEGAAVYAQIAMTYVWAQIAETDKERLGRTGR